MNRSEIAKLLGAASARDRRTVGDSDVLAWHEDVGDLDYDDAREALRRHFRESTDWLMPAHIRRLVAVIHRERRRAQLDADRSRTLEIAGPFTLAHKTRASQLLARLRATLPPGDPAKLRGPHWLSTKGAGTRRPARPPQIES